MNATNFMVTYHQDPGHGWLQVTRKQIVEVGLAPSDFSFFSYRDRESGIFYLEEDCDAPRFLKAAKEAGVTVDVVSKDHHSYSWIRNLPCLR